LDRLDREAVDAVALSAAPRDDTEETMTMSSTPAMTSAPPQRTDLNGCAAMNGTTPIDGAVVASAATAHLPAAVMPRCAPQKWLAGQKALVTGASSGIGRAIALALGEAGADVVVNYVAGEDQARAVVGEIEDQGSRGLALRADVSSEADVDNMFAAMQAELGTIDILVNNAGLQQDAPFEQLTLAQWNKVIGVNLTGQFLCARAAVREFKRRGVRPEVSCSAGKIICISSVHEVIPWAGHVNYAASKGGVMLMMKSIAQEVAPYRIRVNSISPGAIRTPINMQAWETPEAYAELLKLIPYKRIGEAAEIGRAAAWLASDYADYVNGVSLFVDGGMTLYPGFETGG
jgi:glucose 1-dehydrogenase